MDCILAQWFWNVCYAVLGGFIQVWLALFPKILSNISIEEKVPYFMAFNILSMAVVSTSIGLIFNLGGVCVDVLG